MNKITPGYILTLSKSSARDDRAGLALAPSGLRFMEIINNTRGRGIVIEIQ